MPLIETSLIRALQEARHVVVLTGAGVSAESGVPTFREAQTGLWARYDPDRLATPAAFADDPALVWGWYAWRRKLVRQAMPNPAHVAIRRLAELVPRLTLITQNVDDLHERAGHDSVIHLHGSLMDSRCSVCEAGHEASAEVLLAEPGPVEPPRCRLCAAPVRPGVVWFGEALPAQELAQAFAAAQRCELVLSVGTSGQVYPAAAIPLVAARAGARLVQINPAPTPLDDLAEHSLRGAAGIVLPELLDRLEGLN